MLDLVVNGRNVPCEVTRRRVRHVYLRVRPGPYLEIIVPQNWRLKLDEIVARKRRWIEARVAEMLASRRLIDDGVVMYRGQALNVECLPRDGKAEGVELSPGKATIYARGAAWQARLMRSFLTAETLKYAQERARQLTAATGLAFSRITTRDMSKWGYCTRDGRLCFNWRLACLPPDLADYVVVHEFLHLKHFDHSPLFKTALARLLPDFKRMETALRLYVAK